MSPEQSSSLLSSNLLSLKLYTPAQHQTESLHAKETCSTHFTSRLKKDQRKAKNWVQRYNLAKIEENKPKIRSRKRISFDISISSSNNSKVKDGSFTSTHFMQLISNPLDISFKELNCF